MLAFCGMTDVGGKTGGLLGIREEETVQDEWVALGFFFLKYGSFGSCRKHTKQANTTFFGKRKLPPAPCISQMDRKLREFAGMPWSQVLGTE